MHKRWTILLVVVLAVSILAGCSKSPIVATVNGEEITKKQLDKRVNLMLDQFERMYGMTLDPEKDKDMLQEVREQSVESMIQERIMLQEAEKRGIKADSKEVNSNFNSVKSSMGDDKEFKEFLKKTTLTEKDIKEILANQSIIDQLREQVVKDVKVSDAEAQEYFNKNPGKYDKLRELQVSHILVKEEKAANDILAELKKGADFATLAKEKSVDEASAAQGGDLGWVNETTQFVPEFLNAAMALKAGQMTDKPVKSDFGYHIIKAFDEHPAEKAEFAKVASTVKEDALEEKQATTFDDFLKELEEKAQIKKFPENYTDKAKADDKDTEKDTEKDTDKDTNADTKDSEDKK